MTRHLGQGQTFGDIALECMFSACTIYIGKALQYKIRVASSASKGAIAICINILTMLATCRGQSLCSTVDWCQGTKLDTCMLWYVPTAWLCSLDGTDT